MKLRILSDLHLEFDRGWKLKHYGEDAILCAGDLGSTRVREEVTALVNDSAVPFYYVAGNHDFYHGEVGETLAWYQRLARAVPHFHLLHNESVELGQYLLLGTPLWTDFTLYGRSAQRAQMAAAEIGINDFRLTRNGPHRLTPTEMGAWHRNARVFLRREIARNRPTIVTTHWCPSAETIHPGYAGDPMNPYFTTECKNLMQKNVKLWVHGHSHTFDDRLIGFTRVLRNPKGYPRETSGFREDLVIDLP